MSLVLNAEVKGLKMIRIFRLVLIVTAQVRNNMFPTVSLDRQSPIPLVPDAAGKAKLSKILVTLVEVADL